MTTIAATTSSHYATPARTLQPAKPRDNQSTTDALLELTRAAHSAVSSAVSSAEGVAAAVYPAASASAGLAAALWNLDSSAAATVAPFPEISAAAQPDAAAGIETEVLKALAQALGVDEAA